MIRIGLCGATGKMGQVIIKCIEGNAACKIIMTFNSSNDVSELDYLCKNSDVVIDFSHPAILEQLIHYATIHDTRLVIGTTGFSESQMECISDASGRLAVLYSANMSLGANLIAFLASISSKILRGYDIEIIESHHRDKKDAPSGTAVMIAKILAKTMGKRYDECVVLQRTHAARGESEIGISSIRGGKIFGEHEVLFLGDDEAICLKHQALNRRLFADGAVIAANWIVDKSPGLYSMLDIFDNLGSVKIF